MKTKRRKLTKKLMCNVHMGLLDFLLWPLSLFLLLLIYVFFLCHLFPCCYCFFFPIYFGHLDPLACDLFFFGKGDKKQKTTQAKSQ